ncbi:hypothetical protein M8C21_017725 [Ambrosia artemisiifolia]|uniref:Uncharacterized protein n=1 Tax=Ambrosia artemisiifolia TaxID=4212 RepID=A0AAD5GUU9_AMBAR|nr:hypothetical protein M8C21_017725 [Ambrosia artemisiifolia]
MLTAGTSLQGEENKAYCSLEVFLRIGCYMAKREVESEVSVDLARESLIALSYSLPETVISSTELPKSVKNVTEAVNTDEKDKVRSDLISIAYAESPDAKDSPAKTNGQIV